MSYAIRVLIGFDPFIPVLSRELLPYLDYESMLRISVASARRSRTVQMAKWLETERILQLLGCRATRRCLLP
jgi:hypothetical protein